MKRRDKDRTSILLGAHFSIAGGLHNALFTAGEYGCTALQIFTKNANTWKERILDETDIRRFRAARQETGIHEISSHTSYLINLASPSPGNLQRSQQALKNEIIRSSLLEIPYVIMHPGAHLGSGEENGLRRIALAINEIFAAGPDITSRLLLETTAGQGSNLGSTFEHLARIFDMIEAKEKIGFCLDTCHLFAAGYDLRTETAYEQTMRAFDKTLGIDRLGVIHLNDSKKGLGSRVDRHEHIGEGAIGIDAFRFVMNDRRLKACPKIIETPKKNGSIDHDLANLKRLRSLLRKT